MSETTITELIKFFGILGGAVITCINLGGKYFKHRDKKLEENSVGLTKIKELLGADETVREDIKKLQHNDKKQDDDIETLNEDYKRLINRVWDFLGKK